MAKFLIFLVNLYKRFLSPYLGGQCRFYPTCSTYMIQAIEKYGAVKGTAKGIWRILRCNPLNKNCGYDPVK
ncbi:membrane protein insertion efficiency factor YidD [bacterium]|nr:membrane protein insertion efficiency factor YidD [bacterium]